MKAAALAVAMFVTCAVAAGSVQRTRQFLLGVQLLSARQGLSDAQKAAYYLRLQQLTQVTAKEAIDYVSRYRDRPDAWKKLHEELARMAEELGAPLSADSATTGFSLTQATMPQR